MYCRHHVKELVIIIPLHYRIDNMAYRHNSAKLPHLLSKKPILIHSKHSRHFMTNTTWSFKFFPLSYRFYIGVNQRDFTLFQLWHKRIRQKLKTAFFLKLTTAAQILLKKESASTNIPAERHSPSLRNCRLHKSTKTFLKTTVKGLYIMLSFCRNDGDSHRSHPNRASQWTQGRH